jgi:hypothetical protein
MMVMECTHERRLKLEDETVRFYPIILSTFVIIDPETK